ncbi:hypothetical protein MINS_21420 [Mycolicibacterium insubricum]|mgnify:CR=1 FL=1|jgi:hypothetical protein|nr:hypothetical protein [Mycolicibacterium insubricum]MCB9439888.1 hypothetical protein [Mycolicibacterium sp.]MCV7080407.1 hypothetical protein [Mycolicibacterium insubricum]BBZ66713.1 hypothetical protein MINS_21420 [Mycolicibacterium insubricum]
MPEPMDARDGGALAIVRYFDGLSRKGATLDELVRAAARLAGVPAGVRYDGLTVRFAPNGRRLPETVGVGVANPEIAAHAGPVWLERRGMTQPNDELIAERLAVAAEVIGAYRAPAGLLTAIDAAHSYDMRATGLADLNIETDARVRLIATPPSVALADTLSAVVPTRYGLLRATLVTSDSDVPTGRAGLGLWVRADHAPQSWLAAVIAYRLAEPDNPIIDAVDLGALLVLAQAYDPDNPHPDVTALSRLDVRTAMILRALVEADSIRSAASALQMHHSTVQVRHEALTRELGYDPRTPVGRMRYSSAEMLRRLTIDWPTA